MATQTKAAHFALLSIYYMDTQSSRWLNTRRKNGMESRNHLEISAEKLGHRDNEPLGTRQ
jgi:hypothetical protein